MPPKSTSKILGKKNCGLGERYNIYQPFIRRRISCLTKGLKSQYQALLPKGGAPKNGRFVLPRFVTI